jgi:DNA invertase Pin-like site-specific DNA recombinase
MKRNVIAVKRVSTPGQVGDDKYGMARQDHDIEQAVKAHGLNVVRTIEVVESGSTAFNGEDFKQLFADLALPHIAGAAVSAIDRLVRPGYLGDLQVFDPFQRHQKLIFTPSQVIDIATDGGYLMAGMFGMNAGLEKRAILKRTLDGKERARDRGKHPGGAHTLPRGLEYVRERDDSGKVVKTYWRYGADAARVLKAYDLLFAGMSYRDIAKAVGFRTGRGVASILRNTVWKGIRTFEPNASRRVPLEKPMGIRPLISAERWQAAQDILDRKRTATRARRRPTRTPSLALGLLRCRCGRFYYLRRDYRPGQHDLFYCGSSYKKGNGCASPSLRRTQADAAVEQAIAALANVRMVRKLVDAALKKPSVKPQAPAKTERELARVAAEQERLIDLRVKGKISEDQFDERDAKLAREERDLQAMLPKPEPVLDPHVLAAAISSLLAEFAFLPRDEQNAHARRLFVAFEVNDDGDSLNRVVMRGDVLSKTYANNTQRCSVW